MTSVTVGGTVSASNGHAIIIENDSQYAVDPEITVWKIESSDSLVKVAVNNTEDRIKSDINYIIKADATENGETSSNGKIMLTGTSGKVTIGEGDDAKTYDTAHQGETITINVETVKGYKSTLQNNGTGTLTVNSDGTYTLTIPEGGGVDLKAVLEKIGEQRRASSSDDDDDPSDLIYYMDGKAIRLGTGSDWTQDAAGWKYRKSTGSYASSEWLELDAGGRTDWYHFNAQGYVDGGWLTDIDGHRYYLCDESGDRFGHMYTGWHQIGGKWYYFNTESTATAIKGALVTNGTTPDGYTVDETGARVM